MIRVTDGWAVERLIRRVGSAPELYDHLVLCAPFIDAVAADQVRHIVDGGCPVLVITTARAAHYLESRMGPSKRGACTVIRRPHLHAKVYLSRAVTPEDSEVIVTSANLTAAGFRHNIEIGVWATPTTPAGRCLYLEASRLVLGTHRIDITGNSFRRQRSAS